jgi:surface protein
MKTHIYIFTLLISLFWGDLDAQNHFRYRLTLPSNGIWTVAGSPNGSYLIDVRDPQAATYIYTNLAVTSAGVGLNLPNLANQDIEIDVFDNSVNGTIYTEFYWHSSNDRTRLKQIQNWGNIRWTSMVGAFEGCTNLTITAIAKPDVSMVTDFSRAFKGCSSITTIPDIFNWSTQNATKMTEMFNGCTNFNGNLTNWDIRNVWDFGGMFYGCTNFNGTIAGSAGLNPLSAYNMSYMFSYCPNFNQDISGWNTSNVEYMSSMFEGATSFNQPIGNWNTVKVRALEKTFKGATSFNQPLNWNLPKITSTSSMFEGATAFNSSINFTILNVGSDLLQNVGSMFKGATAFNHYSINNFKMDKATIASEMFMNATSFNQSLDAWRTSSIAFATSMFEGATSFNQPLNTWNTANLILTEKMFKGATAFNQPLNNWNMKRVDNANEMFLNATAFNQNLGSWQLEILSTATQMFNGSALSCSNYSSTLIGWASYANVGSNANFSTNKQYSADAVAARNTLTNTKNWTISDGGLTLCSVSAGSNSPICEGSTLNLTSDSGGTSYAWTGPNGYTSNQQNPVISNAGLNGAGTYTVTVTAPGGGTFTSSTHVVINAKPTVGASSNSPICQGSTLNLTASAGASSYTWTYPNGSTSNAQNPSIANAPLSTQGTYTLTVTNGSCSATTSTTVIINPITSPTVSISATSPVCENHRDTINVSPNNLGTYTWTFPNGNTSTSTNGQLVINGANASHNGTFSVTVTNATTCILSTATISVVVNPLPTAPSISGGNSSVLCVGGSTTFTATAAPNLTIGWIRNGEILNNETSSSLTTNKAGRYSTFVTDAAGCRNYSTNSTVVIGDHVFSGSITAANPKQTGRITRNGISSTCSTSKTCQIFTSTGNFGYATHTITNPRNTPVCANIGLNSCDGAFAVAYLGSFNPTNLCQNYLGDVGNSSTNNYVFMDINIPANGTVIVVVHEVNSTGCGAYNLIVDIPRETPAITVSPSPVACGSQATLTASIADTYLWSNGGATTKTISPTITPTNSNYSVTLGYGNNGCTATATTAIAVNPTSFSNTNQTETRTISGASPVTFFGTSCDVIGTVTPTGATPISGSTTAKSWYESTQPTNFVRRHIEISPTIGASTATGTVTLYFTQAEFDDYNAVNTSKLPTNGSDVAGISRLLVEKRGGSSSDGTGLPNSYSGTVETIDPADANVVWNATDSRWEVTISVTGFSGFFVKAQNVVLPVELLAFEGKNTEGGNILVWQTANEKNNMGFDVELSYDGKNFQKIGFIKGKGNTTTRSIYDFFDKNPFRISYYRLKQIDVNGSFSYSKTVVVEAKRRNQKIKLFPNPADVELTVEMGQNIEVRNPATGGTEGGITIVNSIGQVVFQQKKPPLGVWRLDVSTWASGVYFVKSDDEIVKFIKN